MLKARNLPKMDITGLSGNKTLLKDDMKLLKEVSFELLSLVKFIIKYKFLLISDPYVKIYLLYNDQRIAKKKTHVKKRTLNPVFNESFVFELPHLEEGLKNISLEFMLLDWDRVTKNEVKLLIYLHCLNNQKFLYTYTTIQYPVV